MTKEAKNTTPEKTDDIITVPWQGAGVAVNEDEIKTAEQLMVEADLDWKVVERPLSFTPDPMSPMREVEVKTHKMIMRDTDHAPLGVVGIGWTPFQNHEAFDFVDKLIEAGALRYHSAGSFKNGSVIWIQAEFAQSEILPGDVHKKYLLLVSSFDGSFSIRIGETDIRVSCMNTLRMALVDAAVAEKDKISEIRIRHTQSLKEKVAAAEKAILMARARSLRMDSFMKALTRLHMTSEMWTDFGLQMIPKPEEGKRTTRSDNNRNAILGLAATGRGQDIPGVAGTGYAAFNAVTEFVNYKRSSRGEGELQKQHNRFKSTLIGQSGKMVAHAATVLNGYLVNQGLQVETV